MKKILLLIIFAILCLAPVIFPDYWVLILSEILIMGFFAMSFNLLLGWGGLLSFGHAAFFGIGSYSAALLIQHGVSSIGLLILAGIFVTVIVSAVVGFLSVRHDEIYFAMITLAFGMMLFTIAHNWTSLTGGSDGLPIMNMPNLHFLGKEFSLFNPVVMYYLIFAVVCAGIFILYKIVNSPFGLLLKGMKENKMRLSFSGGNISLIRLYAFVISATFSGIAGILFAIFSNMATPDFLHWSFSAKPVIMSILGGSGIFMGPLFGAGVFYLLEQIIRQYTDNWMIFLGLVLIPIVLFFPEGILGTIIKFFKKDRKN